jgi:hypothetical protein
MFVAINLSLSSFLNNLPSQLNINILPRQKEIIYIENTDPINPKCLTLIHSFSSLSYDTSKASSKASSPHNAIQRFLFQMRVSSPFLKVIQQLSTSSSLSFCHFYLPCIFPSVTRCRRQFRRKMYYVNLTDMYLWRGWQ